MAINPFTEKDLALARQVVDMSIELINYYDRCANCGGNVAALKQQAQAHLKMAEAILREFDRGNLAI